MELQGLRQAASQGTISLPPLRDSEKLEDIPVLRSCLALARGISDFREAFATSVFPATIGKLMTIVEAKEQLYSKEEPFTLKEYFYSTIVPNPSELSMVRMESYVNACLELYPNSNLSYISTKTIVEIANFFIQDKISWRSSDDPLHEKPFFPEEEIMFGSKLKKQMNNWEVYAREIRDMDPYVHLILFVLYFVALSPLNKHNERTSQILYQIGLHRKGIDSPFPCIQLGKAKNTTAHFGIEERLYGLRTRQWTPYLKYSLNNLSRAFNYSLELLKAIERLYEQSKIYLQEIGLGTHVAFLPAIFECPACRTGEFSSKTGTRRQVASHILNDLTRADILERVEDGRDKIFFHKRLIEALENREYSFQTFRREIDPFIPLYQKGTPGRTKKEPA